MSKENKDKKIEPMKLSLKEQVKFVKENFKSDGLLLTLEIKRISGTQCSLHGVLYEMDFEEDNDIVMMEGLVVYQIQDMNTFKEQEVALAFNLGEEESIVDRVKEFFRGNTSMAFSQVANVVTSLGLKIFG